MLFRSDTSTVVGKFFLTVMSALAEMERGLISERTLEGMHYLKEEQLRFTRAIYGWDHDENGDLFPNWEEQSWINYMAWQVRKNRKVSKPKKAEVWTKDDLNLKR